MGCYDYFTLPDAKDIVINPYYYKLTPRNVESKIFTAGLPAGTPAVTDPNLPEAAQFKLHNPLLPPAIKLGIH